MKYWIRVLAGSPNVARVGDREGPFEDIETAVAAGKRAMEDYPPEHPDDAGVRGYVVEDDAGTVIWSC